MRASFHRPFLLVSAVLLLAGCDASSEEGGQGGMQMPPAVVSVETLTTQDVPLTPSYPARTQGSREVEVRARVGGILLERTYEEGQFIEEGTVLFRIDPAPYKVALDRARAQYQQAAARLKAAERNWERVNPLFQEKAVSARTRDEALSELETAKAEVSAALAEINAAKLDLGYTEVKAPISGIASKETVSEGSLIGTGQADSLLTRMTRLDPIYVNFAYPDADFMMQRRLMESQIVPGPEEESPALQATLTLSNGQEYAQAGTVSFTDAVVDEQTGSVQARAVFPNPDGALMPGQFVRITLQGMTLPNAITVPQDAVMQGPQGKFVYKLGPDNTAQIAPIKTATEYKDMWVVEEGLSAGDTIITQGIIKVIPNQPVSVQPDGPPDGMPPAPPVEDAGNTNAVPGDMSAFELEAAPPEELSPLGMSAQELMGTPPVEEPATAPDMTGPTE